jgi:hypothetical protein
MCASARPIFGVVPGAREAGSFGCLGIEETL